MFKDIERKTGMYLFLCDLKDPLMQINEDQKYQ